MGIKLTKKDIITICRWHGWQCVIEDDYSERMVRTPYVRVWKDGFYSERLGRKWDVEYLTMPEIVQLLANVEMIPVEKEG